VPEPLRNPGFEEAFGAISKADREGFQRLAWKMAKDLERIGIDGDDLFQETNRRCLAIKEWPLHIDVAAIFVRTMFHIQLDCWRNARRSQKKNDAFKCWRDAAGQSQADCTPEQEVAVQRYLDEFLPPLNRDARRVVEGRTRGLKGKELVTWCGFDQTRYDNACQSILRLRNKMDGG